MFRIGVKPYEKMRNLLKWLYLNNSENLYELNGYEWEIENIAANAVKNDYLGKVEDDLYNWGIDTPHIVFNYLDSLLWKGNRKEYSDFVFEFRNAVEH